MKNKQQRLLKFILLLSFLGVLISGYLVKVHFSESNGLCDLGPVLSCTEVSRSQQAEIFGIPMAFIGLFGYVFLGMVSYGIYKKESLDRKHLFYNKIFYPKIFSSAGLLFFSAAALLFSVYLTYAEFFIIKALCLFCLFSQAVILGIAFFSYRHHLLERSIRRSFREEEDIRNERGSGLAKP